MRRPLFLALGGAFVALLLLFGFSAWLFSHNMGQARAKSEERMSALALYIVEHIHEDVFSYPFAVSPSAFPEDYAEEQSQWLSRLTHATGLERVVITDSTGHVYAGSQPLLSKADDISPYLVDTALFRLSARTSQSLFTKLSNIDGVYFQSLYHSFKLHDQGYMIVLESDQNFIAYVDQFRGYLVFASSFLLILFALLSVGIYLLDRKFQSALAESHRNEHLAFLGRTSAELAHELKNPLAIMKSSIDVLKGKFDPKGEHAAFGYLSEEAMRLSRMIGNILGFSKDRPLESKPFQPRGALSEVRETHRMEFPNVEWEVELPGELIILGDRDSFRQIADNLARNASRAMGEKGHFKVTYHTSYHAKAAGNILFSDSGPGLPKEIRGKLFEPFVSGSKTGTGLGLAIVQSLCERCDWKIAVESDGSQMGKPTCFALRISKDKIVRKTVSGLNEEPTVKT